MAQSTLSLLGLYNYDNSILDDLALPTAMEESRETITDNLLFETSEMEILYPDPVVLKAAIRVWSTKSLPVWQELYDTTQYEYNPIWNKDGTFTELETRNLTGLETRNLTSLETRNLTGLETRNLTGLETRNLTGGSQDSGSGSGTTEYDVFGYNSETAAHEHKTTESNTYSRTSSSTQGGTINNSNTGTINNSDTGTINNSDTGTINNSDTGTIRTERTEQGNIGITSTQELIERQRAVVEFNIMDRIINDFKNRFCLMVY